MVGVGPRLSPTANRPGLVLLAASHVVIGDVCTLGIRRYLFLSRFWRRCYGHRAFVAKSAAATVFVCATSSIIPYYYLL